VAGVLEASGRTQSFGALRNYYPQNSVEYVFNPQTGQFVVGRPAASAGFNGSPHQQLAQSIGADRSTVVGGTLTRRSDGVFVTTENSGHYWQNWTPAVREQFVDTMRGYGFDVIH
jgi:filamentous hemagglutinin